MELNTDILEKVRAHKGKLLAVTKYLTPKETHQVFEILSADWADVFWGVGENRGEALEDKARFIPREKMHFIGNIQSKKIAEIAQYCSVLHSLDHLKHAQKFANTPYDMRFFVQVKLDPEKKTGVTPQNLASFLEDLSKIFSAEKIIGLSGMGQGNFLERDKREEFQLLQRLRGQHLPHGEISAGTSRDFEIALDEGIEVVRVGKGLFN